MLKGKRVDLRIAEKEDVDLINDWFTDQEMMGGFQLFPRQRSKFEREKDMFEPKNPNEAVTYFIVQKKDRSKIGTVIYFDGGKAFGGIELGYAIIPSERGHGYATEATQMMVDYLFLSNLTLERIQATTNKQNEASQKVLLKAGFAREGEIRKGFPGMGKRVDGFLFSVTRDDWREPRILSIHRNE